MEDLEESGLVERARRGDRPYGVRGPFASARQPSPWSSNGRASSRVVAASSVSGSQYGRDTQQGKAAGGAAGTRTDLVQQPWRRRGSVSHHQDARRYRRGHPAIARIAPASTWAQGSVSRPTLSQLGASRAGETHRAEWAYDQLNVLDAPHPWTVHRDRGAVAWRLNPQPAPRDQRGGATRRSRDRWRLLRLELFRLLRVAPPRAARRSAPRREFLACASYEAQDPSSPESSRPTSSVRRADLWANGNP